jgi:hypothetical protein
MDGPGLCIPSKRCHKILAMSGGMRLPKMPLGTRIMGKGWKVLENTSRIGVALLIVLLGSGEMSPWLRTVSVWIRKRGIPSRCQGRSEWYWSGGARGISSKVRGARGMLEDDAVVIALAIPLRLGAIDAYWSFFTTLDATFSACCVQLVPLIKARDVVD